MPIVNGTFTQLDKWPTFLAKTLKEERFKYFELVISERSPASNKKKMSIIGSALELAIKYRFNSKLQDELVKVIANSGVNLSKVLFEAIPLREPYNIYFIKKMLDYGANINERDEWGSTPLISACIMECLGSARFLIKHKAVINNDNLKSKFNSDPIQCLLDSKVKDSAIYIELLDAGYSGRFSENNCSSLINTASIKGLDDVSSLVKSYATSKLTLLSANDCSNFPDKRISKGI